MIREKKLFPYISRAINLSFVRFNIIYIKKTTYINKIMNKKEKKISLLRLLFNYLEILQELYLIYLILQKLTEPNIFYKVWTIMKREKNIKIDTSHVI
jgi:hypothetical protein